MKLETKLVHAVTEFDRAQSRRKGYNPHALAHYLRLASAIALAIENGQAPRDAARTRCSDRLLATILRALGETAPTVEEARGHYLTRS